MSTNLYEHHSGEQYVLLHTTNEHADDPEQWPSQAVYMAIKTGFVWSRPIAEFYKKFTPVEPKLDSE